MFVAMGRNSSIDRILARIQRQPDDLAHQKVRKIVDLLIVLAKSKPRDWNGPLEIAEATLEKLFLDYRWEVGVLYRDKRLIVGLQPTINPRPSAWERDAVLALMDADPHLIKSCTGRSGKCKGLFYATRANNTTCSRACISARHDADPKKYGARLKVQRENHAATKKLQDAEAKRAARAVGRVAAKRTRADHKTTTDSATWIVARGGLAFGDKKTKGAVWKAINRGLGASRKTVQNVAPNLASIAAHELDKQPYKAEEDA
jgi:hypothetical protein